MISFSPRRLLKIVLILLVGQFILRAQNIDASNEKLYKNETGFPFIKNYKPKETHSLPQNTSIIQDNRGVMYFGNSAGVLEFDGSTWRLIKLPNFSEAYSLAIDENGQIFVGGNNELGYLSPDKNGQMHYVSLLAYLDESNKEFGPIWKTITTSEGVYFEALKCLIRFKKNLNSQTDSLRWKSFIWKPKTSFYRIHFVHNKLFVSLPNKLMEVQGDSLQLILNHEQYTKSTISLMLPYFEKKNTDKQTNLKILIGTRYSGLFIYDGKTLQPADFDANVYLRKNALYHGTILPGDRYAFATLWGGAVTVDAKGHINQIADKTSGLHNQNILYVFPDREGGLWLGTDNGIARVETSTPLSFFKESQGLNGATYAITRHKNHLFLGTSSGLAYLDNNVSDGSSASIKYLPGNPEQVRAILSIGSKLLVGGSDGIYQVNENQNKYKIAKDNPSLFRRSVKDPGRIYVSLMDGLGLIQIIDGEIQPFIRIPYINSDIRLIAEENDGVIWAGGYPQNLWRIELPKGEISEKNIDKIEVEQYSQANDLSEGWIMPYTIKNKIVFATANGLRRFDYPTKSFKIDSSLGLFFADTNRVFYSLVEDSNNKIWMIHSYKGKEEVGYAAKGEDGIYCWNSEFLSGISDFGYNNVIYADPIKQGVVWFGCEEALVRYDPMSPNIWPDNFSSFVRRVTIKGDSVIYGGSGKTSTSRIPFKYNSIKFDYAATSFNNPSETYYQYYLEGFEENWSDWENESKKEYTSLSGGKYFFHVRARNVNKKISNEAVYTFTILQPWYKTWWAYIIYVFLFVFSVLNIVQLRISSIKKKAMELENIIEKRTDQIEKQKDRLQEQSYKLQEMDRIKSRFFTNISHEFRTPLTIILGSLDNVLIGEKKQISVEETTMMHRNAKNLLRLVNQLLDLSRLETGKMKLQASAGDLIECINKVVNTFNGMSKSRNIKILVQTSHTSIKTWFNQEQLEAVINNLLMNAFKYTPDGGKIEVIVVQDKIYGDSTQLNKSPKHYVKIAVKDNGIGIPEDKLPYVFDYFYQVNNNQTDVSGTGIGLALVKELVELHYGVVNISSKPDSGTEVSIKLPMGKNHLNKEEIITLNSTYIPDSIPEYSPNKIKSADKHIESKDSFKQSDNELIVLIVEDNIDMRTYIKTSLNGKYQIIEAENGETGLKKAFETIPDLIISDVMMPKIDGFELCKKLKNDERTSHIPIILLTAKAEMENKLDGLEIGADDYLTKPFNTRELNVKIRNLILLRQSIQEKYQKLNILLSEQPEIGLLENKFLNKAINIVQVHLEDESFSPIKLANELKMSRAQLYRKIRAITNQSGSEFIRSVRLQRAMELLKQGDSTITEIAYKVGFSSHSYFTKCFTEYYGMSPKKFIQNHNVKH